MLFRDFLDTRRRVSSTSRRNLFARFVGADFIWSKREANQRILKIWLAGTVFAVVLGLIR